MRNQQYIDNLLYFIWEDHFPDMPRKNFVLIKFGKYSTRQLGSIKWARQNSKIKTQISKYLDTYKVQDDKRISIITLTRYFQHEEVPEFMLIATIAHELVHYLHGFHSPLQKRFKHPHQGNIVNRELTARRLGTELEASEKWLKAQWVPTFRLIDQTR